MATCFRWLDEQTFWGPPISGTTDLFVSPALDVSEFGMVEIIIYCASRGADSPWVIVETAIADDTAMWVRATPSSLLLAPGSKKKLVLKASQTSAGEPGILERFIRLKIDPDSNETWWYTLQVDVIGYPEAA